MIQRAPVIACVLATLLFQNCDKDKKETTSVPEAKSEPAGIGNLQITTASESSKRAAILPTKGSEDMSSLLGKIAVPVPEQANPSANEYLPNPAVEWIIQVTPDKPLRAREIGSMFGKDWRAKYGGLTLFGREAANGLWTYLISADGREEVDGIQFAWDYFSSLPQEAQITDVSMYQSRLEAVEQEMSRLAKVSIRSDVSPQEAHERSQYLSTLGDRFDRSVAIRLVAPSGKRFAGREVWDVMLSLGLRWGDMDCFHWENPSGYGDDFYFSVWTSTEPGYFLPEQVAANQLNVEDLIFGYSIPRSADPFVVYERMREAVEYAQKRLGGKIVSDDGGQIQHEEVLKEIKAMSEELGKLGFRPGSDNALQQF